MIDWSGLEMPYQMAIWWYITPICWRILNIKGKGFGKKIVAKMQEKYAGFHMQMPVTDGKAVEFYKRLGFVRAGKTEPLWIYSGNEHG